MLSNNIEKNINIPKYNIKLKRRQKIKKILDQLALNPFLHGTSRWARKFKKVQAKKPREIK